LGLRVDRLFEQMHMVSWRGLQKPDQSRREAIARTNAAMTCRGRRHARGLSRTWRGLSGSRQAGLVKRSL